MATKTDPLKVWIEAHDTTAISRVVKRIRRFSTNTPDNATAQAAASLADLIDNVTPAKSPMGETDA